MRKRIIDAVYRANEGWERNPVLMAVRRGLMLMIPLLLLGSFALVVVSLPIPGYREAMARLFGPGWTAPFLYVRDGTNNVFSVLLVVCIAYSYAVEYHSRRGCLCNPAIAAVVSLGSFVALSGMSSPGFALSTFGTLGVFVAIASAVVSSLLFLRLMSAKRLRLGIFSVERDSTLNQAVESIVPAAVTVACFAALHVAFDAALGGPDIQAAISDAACGLFSRSRSGAAFGTGALYVLVSHAAWFFGIHGGNMLEPVAGTVLAPALEANRAAIAAGLAPTEIFTKTFFDVFVLMGGCGTTLCLVFAIWLVGRDRTQRRVVNISLLPVIFNINELLVFGIPIVLNPIFLVPFLATPLLMTLTSFLAARYGLVPLTSVDAGWTTPVLLGGCIATGSWRGGLLQAANLCLGTLCYVPFVLLSKRAADSRAETELDSVYSLYRAAEECGSESALLARMDEAGNVARLLVADLDRALREGEVEVFYQPQVSYGGVLFGVESLLRWRRGGDSWIYPPLIVGLAQEAGIVDRLGYYILDRACADMERLNGLLGTHLVNSVNISAVQLMDESFVGKVKDILARHGLDPRELEIEVTEQLALASGDKIVGRIKELQESGVRLAMDDFGMGHTSILYLKEYKFDTVKLDGSLVEDLSLNPACRSIVSSIVELGSTMHFSVLAEYVESPDQREELHGLGCDLYQGYLFGKAMPFDELTKYIAGSESSAIA